MESTPQKYYYPSTFKAGCLQPCLAGLPEHQFGNPYIGSAKCTQCNHCQGYGNDPKPYIICDIIDKATNG